VPRLRVPRPSLPFAVVHAKPETAADRAARGERAARYGEMAGRSFARLTAVPVIAVVSWLVPGLPLLLGGVFDPVPELLIAAPLFAVLAVNLLHKVPGQWPAELPGSGSARGWQAWFGMLGTAAVTAGFIVWQLAANSPSVIATRMPGAYFQTGYWIAQHGSLPIPGSLAAFGGPHPDLHLSSIGFVAVGHDVWPGVTSGLPMLLAGGFWTTGTGGGAVIGPVIGGLAVLSFGGLVARLAGRQWAPAGALVLALTLPELYTSRNAFSEPAVQVLLFGGTCLVIDALTVGPMARPLARKEPPPGPAVSLRKAVRPAGDTGLTRSFPLAREPADTRLDLGAADTRLDLGAADTAPMPAVGPEAAVPPNGVAPVGSSAGLGAAAGKRRPGRRVVSSMPIVIWRELPARITSALTPETMLAALGGLALGLTSLLSLAALPYLVPMIAVAAVFLAARVTAGVAFSLGLVVGCGYGFAAAYLLARPPAWPQTVPLKLLGLDAGGLALLIVAAALVMRARSARRIVRRALDRGLVNWLPAIGSALVIIALGWLAIRPYVQVVRGDLGSGAARYVGMLQRLAGLRADPTRLYSEDTLYWVVWYAGIATVLLGAFGAAIMIRRCLRALLSWQDSSGASLNWTLPLAVTLGGAAAVLWQPFTIPDQPWASRRLVPVVIPGLILLATWAGAWLTRRARERGAGTATAAVVGAFCVGAMLLPSVSTSFGLSLSHSGSRGGLRPTAGGLAQHSVGAHEADAVRGLCSAIGRSSSVVIVDRHVAAVFSEVIRGMCGVPVGWIPPNAQQGAVQAVLAGIARSGRRAVVLGSRPAQVAAFGGSPTRVMNLNTTQYPHELTQPPGAPWRARYKIWMATVGTPGAGV
jgi:hypothetical protein